MVAGDGPDRGGRPPATRAAHRDRRTRTPIDRLLDLSLRTAIVTGASGGIGASIAAALAGAQVQV